MQLLQASTSYVRVYAAVVSAGLNGLQVDQVNKENDNTPIKLLHVLTHSS